MDNNIPTWKGKSQRRYFGIDDGPNKAESTRLGGQGPERYLFDSRFNHRKAGVMSTERVLQEILTNPGAARLFLIILWLISSQGVYDLHPGGFEGGKDTGQYADEYHD